MTCPRCQRHALAREGTCAACGYVYAESEGVNRVTAEGDPGPLQDLVLRDPGVVSGRVTFRVRQGAPAARARSSGAPLLEFRQEVSTFGSSPGHEGRPPRRRIARRTPAVSDGVRRRAGRSASEPSLEFEATEASAEPGRRKAAGDGGVVRLVLRRFVAGLLDIGILIGIDAGVVYFTLRLASLPVGGTGELPVAPLLAFLFLFDAGYVVVLTACGGQTIGKMAAGLRVETGSGKPVTLATSVARTAAYAVSVLPAGLGFLGVLLKQRRTLHDLIARTRVVRVA